MQFTFSFCSNSSHGFQVIFPQTSLNSSSFSLTLFLMAKFIPEVTLLKLTWVKLHHGCIWPLVMTTFFKYNLCRCLSCSPPPAIVWPIYTYLLSLFSSFLINQSLQPLNHVGWSCLYYLQFAHNYVVLNSFSE